MRRPRIADTAGVPAELAPPTIKSAFVEIRSLFIARV
jgi:hypothetical protein